MTKTAEMEKWNGPVRITLKRTQSEHVILAMNIFVLLVKL